MTQDQKHGDLQGLRNEIAELTAAVIRLDATVELLRQHLVGLSQRTSALESGGLTPRPQGFDDA